MGEGGGVELACLISRLPSSVVGEGGGGGGVVDLTESEASGSSRGSCSICLENFEGGEVTRVLPCFHCFHSACVDKWFHAAAQSSYEESGHTRDRAGRPTCPVCKIDVASSLGDDA